MNWTLDKLRARGLVAGTIGEISPQAKLAFNVWARKAPKRPFLAFTALAQTLSEQPMIVYVNDALSMVAAGRTIKDQSLLNDQYRDFFNREGCAVEFSSDIYSTNLKDGLLASILEIGNRMSVNEFIRCLPRERRANYSQCSLADCLHALLELTLMEHIGRKCDTLLIGHFSQAIVASHRNLSRNPLAAVVLPKLTTEESVNRYIRSLTST
jgi:hypothetical protein